MPHQVLPNNQEDREVYLREHNATKFIDAVHAVQAKQLDTVMTTMGAFAGEPKVLYVALDYASASDVTVTIAQCPRGDELMAGRQHVPSQLREWPRLLLSGQLASFDPLN